MNKNIVACIAQTFKKNCIELLLDACDSLKAEGCVTLDKSEENISLLLCDKITDNKLAETYRIIVRPEYPYYANREFLLTHKAKQASRLDLMFEIPWTNSETTKFTVEAKILIEHNCQKATAKTRLNAKSLQKKYIQKGMDRFITNKYPSNGCMLGYVLEGSILEIVKGINSRLQKDGRMMETLVLKEQNLSTSAVADSIHLQQTGTLKLEHYFYKFA